MPLNLRFAVVSDLHIGLPHTLFDHPSRFHLVEVSIPALERVLQHLSLLELDFLLLPGDLTQHGEPENHAWLSDRLTQLPFPVFVIPGNHDVPVENANEQSIGWREFPSYYRSFGYQQNNALYYSAVLTPGVRLIALNSNQFDGDGSQLGCLDTEQFQWLEATLQQAEEAFIFVMVHHNVLEHFPNQTHHPIGQRYMLDNTSALLELLRRYNVQLVFTGHLHVQDIAYREGLFDITTGSLVSYPHPYRIMQLIQGEGDVLSLRIESHRVASVPRFPDLQHFSREWMGDRSEPFMKKMLCQPPLNVPPREAIQFASELRYFWADVAAGDPDVQFPHWPQPLRNHFEAYAHWQGEEIARGITDNCTTLQLEPFHRTVQTVP
jgi:predicted phosphodiesterase